MVLEDDVEVQRVMDLYVAKQVKEMFPEVMTEEEQQEADMVVWTSSDQFRIVEGDVNKEGEENG